MTDLVLSWRLKACKHWRWVPGMLAWCEDDTVTHRVTRVSQSGYPFGCLPDEGVRVWELSADSLPDLNDPATLGCLLELVRQAWDDPDITPRRYAGLRPNSWIVHHGSRCAVGDSEREALVAALEAAP